MVNLDLVLVSMFVRLVLGLFLAGVLGLLGWFFGYWILALLPVNPVTFTIVSVLSIGAMVALGVVLAWWDRDAPSRLTRWGIAAVVSVSLVSSLLTFQKATDSADFTWVHRGIAFPMLNISVLVTNLAAGAIHVYRVTRQREL